VVCNFFSMHVTPRSTKMVARAFLEKSLSLEKALSSTYAGLTASVFDNNVMESSLNMLTRIYKLSRIGYGGYDRIKGAVTTDIFLAAYVIVAHPSKIFKRTDDLQVRLLNSSMDMITSMDKTMRELGKGVPWSQACQECLQREKLTTRMNTYFVAFEVIYQPLTTHMNTYFAAFEVIYQPLMPTD
jgi:hypothetical protein